jgi:hypothetical protein
MTQEDRDREKRPHDWPEPPGYLGEAVRRAKMIPSRNTPTEPPATKD